jgi:cytochrome c oxidase assembly protein subunit 15
MTAAHALFQKGLPLLTSPAVNKYASVGKWILGTGGMVVGMVQVGALTRLTQSGLSMTDWHLLGSLPPITNDEWQAEFARYKQFPEYEQRQGTMTINDFKFIYAWEYGHRMLGRCVGVVFALPWLYFTARTKIPKGFQKNMVMLFTMGGTQGLVGWWMVKSGLGEDRRGDRQEIRVQPQRLAAHLTMAIATYGALLWTGFEILSLPHQSTLKVNIQALSRDALQQVSNVRTGAIALTALTFFTITSGALVAGNDAGRAYNTWPKMGDYWIPPDIGHLTPWHRNLTHDTATVQFNHRLLASTTFLTAIGVAAVGLSPSKWAYLTPQARNGLYAVAITASGQFALGITTLLCYVPVYLAALHQLGSLFLFTSGVYLAHALRYASPILVRSVETKVVKEATSQAIRKANA